MEKIRSNIYFKLGFIVILISMVVSVGTVAFFGNRVFNQEQTDRQLNFLVLGVDGTQQSDVRSDVVMVLSADLDNGKLGVISLPRDTRVRIPSRDSYHKLNAAYAYGGVELALETVEELLKIEIDHYIVSDFNGFINIVDALDGVELEVEEDLNYIDQAGGLYINISAGQQVLTGKDSLDYIRYREESLADIGRIGRQQKFLDALLDSALQAKTIFKIPEMLRHLQVNVESDLNMAQTLKLANSLRNLNREKIAMETLAGKADYINGVSYWLPDPEQNEVLVKSLINSKDYLINSQFRVVLLNGNGEFGLAKEMGRRLSQAGYNVIEVDNADRFDYHQTEVYFRSRAQQRAEKLEDYLNNQRIAWNRVSDGLIRELDFDIKIILGENLI